MSQISCHVTLDITKCMWYPHQINEHPPSNRNPRNLNVLNTPQLTAALGVSMFWINIYPSHQVSFKSWGTRIKLTHECMNVHIPYNDDNTKHLLMNNRPLNPITPSQFASNSHHHIIIKVYIQARYNIPNILANHSSSFQFQSITYIKVLHHHTNLRFNQSKSITCYKTKSNHVISS